MLIAAIKAVHILLFLFLAFAASYVYICGVTGRRDRLLAISVAACAVELLVLAANRWRCPLTGLAERLGAKSGSVADLFIPHGALRYVFPAFGAVFGVGLALILVRGVRRKLR